jgi:hypothetical protein
VDLQLVDQSRVLLLQLLGKLVFGLDELLRVDIGALVEEDVSVGGVVDVSPPITPLKATERLPFQVFFVEATDTLVIELDPPVLLGLHQRIVVPPFRRARVDHHSLQPVISGGGGSVILDEVCEADLLREGELRVDLDLVALLLVVNDALQVENDYLGKSVEVGALVDLGHLLIALFAEVVGNGLLLSEFPQTVH